jgi:hypothetical protein
MDKDAMIVSVKAQIADWIKDAHPFKYNCGPMGRVRGPIDYSAFAEVSNADFDAAVKDLKDYVKVNITGYSGREAASASGTLAGFNVWSFLIEPWDNSNKQELNDHVLVGK